MNRKRRPASDRLWRHVERGEPNECWPWTGGKNLGFRVGSTPGSPRVQAPAYARFLATGEEIKPGQHAHHTCTTWGCCNPDHVFFGPPSAPSPARMAGIRRGAENAKAKLNDEKVREIRRRWLAGETQTALAREFGVAQPVVSEVVRGLRWKHVV